MSEQKLILETKIDEAGDLIIELPSEKELRKMGEEMIIKTWPDRSGEMKSNLERSAIRGACRETLNFILSKLFPENK